MQTVIKGEKRYIGMKVTRRNPASFTIDTATYNVSGIQEGECMVDQGTKEVYFLLDTTNSNFNKNRSYVAQFTVTIQGLYKIIKGEVTINIR